MRVNVYGTDTEDDSPGKQTDRLHPLTEDSFFLESKSMGAIDNCAGFSHYVGLNGDLSADTNGGAATQGDMTVRPRLAAYRP